MAKNICFLPDMNHDYKDIKNTDPGHTSVIFSASDDGFFVLSPSVGTLLYWQSMVRLTAGLAGDPDAGELFFCAASRESSQ